jgi:AcrR family transcriptional regulator
VVSNLTERRREATRAEILAVAERIFYANGIRNTSITQIAEAVGLGRPALYNYFPSKDHLIAATVNAVIERYDPVAHSSRRAVSGTAGIHSLIAEVIASLVTSRGDLRFLMMALLEQLDEPVESQLVHRAVEQLGKRVSALLEEAKASGEVRVDVDSDEAAERLTCDVLGIELMGLMNPAFDFQAAAARVEADFLERITVPGPPEKAD